MSTADRLTVAGALAVALAATALRPLYEDLGWLLPVLGGVLAVAGAGTLARLVRVPRGLQPVVGLLALAVYAAWTFAAPTLAYVLLPTGETLPWLAASVRDGLRDVEQLAAPVPTTSALVLLAVLGTGAVAVAVDTLAVVVRNVAAAGLPLLVLFLVPSGVLPGGQGVLAFVVGAAGWLALLLADGSDRVSRWGTSVRSRRSYDRDPGLGRAGRRIGVAALGVAAVVPALVPGLDGRLLGGSGDGPGLGGARTTTTYNPFLSLAGQLRQPQTRELFTYRTDAGPDYLRMTTLDLFDEDSGWASSELSGDIDDDAVQDGVPPPRGRTAPFERVEVEVDLTRRLAGPWLPVPAVPTVVDIEGAWLWDAEAETVFSTRTSVRDVDEPYTVRASRLTLDAGMLRRPQSVPDDIREAYAAVPDLSPQARELLERTTAGETTDYDRVAALQRLFRETDFEYSEQTSVPPTNAPDALTAFLQTRRGFCEQYASAMAALVRGLGIPARVAVGFTTGTRTDDGSYRVTTREAHAWPEVWFTGAGWVRFEPTPRAGEVDVPSYSVPPREETATGTESAAPSAAPAVPAPTTDVESGALDRGAENELGGAVSGPRDSDRSSWLPAVPVVVLLAVPALLAAARRRRRWRYPDPLVAWQTVQDDAVDVGHRWRPADSPRAAAAHLTSVRHLPDDAADALERLAFSAERARYARTPSAVDVAALRHDSALVRAALRAGAERRGRWQARLAPPSTLRWAGHGLGTAAADALDRADVLVSALGARLRHPMTRRAD